MLSQQAALILNRYRLLRKAEREANERIMRRQGNGNVLETETVSGQQGQAVIVAQGDEEKIAEMYRGGLNIRQISASLPGVARETILQVIRETK